MIEFISTNPCLLCKIVPTLRINGIATLDCRAKNIKHREAATAVDSWLALKYTCFRFSITKRCDETLLPPVLAAFIPFHHFPSLHSAIAFLQLYPLSMYQSIFWNRFLSWRTLYEYTFTRTSVMVFWRLLSLEKICLPRNSEISASETSLCNNICWEAPQVPRQL